VVIPKKQMTGTMNVIQKSMKLFRKISEELAASAIVKIVEINEATVVGFM